MSEVCEMHFNTVLKDVLLLLLTLVAAISAEDCLLPADSNGRDTPFSRHASPSLPNGTQAIIASYKFHCYGNITAWRTYVQANNPTPHVIHFQVWRPSPGTENDGCYALVGENVLSDAVATADGLISTTPGPDDIIRVSPGDVIGYYSQSGSEEDMVGATTTEVLLDTSYADEVVWYHTNGPEDPLISSGFLTCPFPAGPNKALGSFINAAPVISIDMVPATTIAPTPTLTPAPSQTSGSNPTVIPSPTQTGVRPVPPGLGPGYIAGIVLASLVLLAFIIIIIVLFIVCLCMRRRRKRRRDSADHTYEALGIVPQVSHSEITVIPNEAYGAPLSPSISYGSIRLDIKETYNNLTITLNPQR